MTRGAHRLTGLSTRLSELVDTGAEVRLPQEDQLLVRRDMTADPDLPGKTPSQVPAATGYQIHVACRSVEDHAATTSLSQRFVDRSAGPVMWEPGTIRLHVTEADLSPEWTVVNGRGEVVTVRARCGSPAVLHEVNAILAAVEAEVLS